MTANITIFIVVYYTHFNLKWLLWYHSRLYYMLSVVEAIDLASPIVLLLSNTSAPFRTLNGDRIIIITDNRQGVDLSVTIVFA